MHLSGAMNALMEILRASMSATNALVDDGMRVP